MNLRTAGTRNSLAISVSPGSRFSIPSSIPEYTTGSVIRKDISTERLREVTHISANTVILATGTALTAEISGASSCLTIRDFPAASARRVPVSVPRANPRRILPEENPTLRRKSAEGSSCRSLSAALTGDTSNIS